MAFTDFLTAGRVPRDLAGATLVIADTDTLHSATDFLDVLAKREGTLGVGNLGPGEYQGRFACVDLPKAHDADRKRLKKLRPARLIVLGGADERFELVRAVSTEKVWLNASDPRAADTGCRLVTTSGSIQAKTIPGARAMGDPLLNLDALPSIDFDPELCERFREYRERQYPVFYVAMAGEPEIRRAYGMLFDILRKKTAIMLFSLSDPEQHERVYHEAIKYSMPTIRHSRLYTSYVPRKNRVYFVEDAQVRQPLYACSDLTVVGGTLATGAAQTPDLITPILAGRPVMVGPHRTDPLVRAAAAANVILAGEDVESLAGQAMALFDAPEKAADLVDAAGAWLDEQVGARTRVLAALDG